MIFRRHPERAASAERKTMKKGWLSRYVGDRRFYARMLRIVLPIMAQNAITNFVSLLDNIMVGALGTEPMTGVSIVNQLIVVFNLCIFGGLSGAGIFTSQYYGGGDEEGVRSTFRFKLLLGIFVTAGSAAVLFFGGRGLVGLFLHEGGETGDLALTQSCAMDYLYIMLLGLPPYALQQVYSTTLRECGETAAPMKAGFAAIFVNLFFNYVFIFGKLGAPAMGAAGAALATVISRYAEAGVLLLWTGRHPDRTAYLRGAYRTLRVPAELMGRIVRKGMPLLVNECVWSVGMTALVQCYSMRGLAATAAVNISSTVMNLFNIVWTSYGLAVSIMVGQELGASRFEEAKATVRKVMAFSVAQALVLGWAFSLLAPLFPMLYNTTEEVRSLAAAFIRITMLTSFLQAFANASYFIIRAGGRTWVTFLFDGFLLWAFRIPLVRLLIDFTALPIVPIFLVSALTELVKDAVGYILLRRGVFLHNLVGVAEERA